MSEAEELLSEGALFAARRVQEFWRRHGPASEVPQLRDVRDRLELFVTGVWGKCPPLALSHPAPVPGFLARLAQRTPRHLLAAPALPATDGRRILLPRELERIPEDPSGLRRYRLYTLVQALRIERGAAARVPPNRIECDLFVALDGAEILHVIAHELPRLGSDIIWLAERALMARPPLHALTPLERAVEDLVRSELTNIGARPLSERRPLERAVLIERAGESARALLGRHGGRYRGLPGVDCWGELAARAPSEVPASPASGSESSENRQIAARLWRRPIPRVAPDDEEDRRPGMFIVKPGASHESVEDPLGLVRPIDAGQVDAGELADSLAELAEARLVRTPGTTREVLFTEDALCRERGGAFAPARREYGFAYPEWDFRARAYRECATLVQELAAPLGDPGWAERVLHRHARLIDTVCVRFAHLRPNRSRLRRRPDGPDLDIDGYVTAFADRVAGSPAEDGLYEEYRPRRRDFALLLLVDASASTDASIRGRERIIDVEKEALLVLCKALEHLGDRYAIHAFSGEGPSRVTLLPLKRFADPYDASTARRIAGLEPDRYTRLGAALRHATALLAAEPARHRLLLIVSDGKPNDTDEYEGRYGIEDTRQAVLEARLQGLYPFCLTVDRRAPEYARHVFGPVGYTVASHAEVLPRALVDILRRLVVQ